MQSTRSMHVAVLNNHERVVEHIISLAYTTFNIIPGIFYD